MFGYVTPNVAILEKERVARYRAYYCGLCATLKQRHGQKGRITLSNDMTFLYLLLSSLYEPIDAQTEASCVVHPIKKQTYLHNEIAAYCADMNILLAYYKCVDHKKDDGAVLQGVHARMLQNSFQRIKKQYPTQSTVVADCLQKIDALECQKSTNIDALCNLTGTKLGAIYSYKDDNWTPFVRKIGEGLGRFIYLMDAVDDYDQDMRKKRFNPLTELHSLPTSEYMTTIKSALTILVAEATEAFEYLPLQQDIDIMQNVLYSGIWSCFAQLQSRQTKSKEKKDGQ